jgi:hypothetical protein
MDELEAQVELLKNAVRLLMEADINVGLMALSAAAGNKESAGRAFEHLSSIHSSVKEELGLISSEEMENE